MEIKKIEFNDFLNNPDFYKKNLGFLYNFYNWPIYAKKSKEEIEDEVYNIFSNTMKKYINKGFYVVAMEDSKIYSAALFTLENNNVWYVDSVFTHYSKVRQGLATKTISFGLNQICGKCCLHVQPTNISAISLYEKLGFKVDNSKIIDDIEDRIVMSKDIGKKNDKEIEK